ncbi:MAG: riboflavin synthase [Anaerostipes sp.]|nr:riboflavin synthase [Anaerostipes sp.]
MFTGIVEELGTISTVKRKNQSSVIIVKATKVLEDVNIGDSIAVNGVCLTVKMFDKSTFQADVMNETFDRSNLGNLKSGDPVNLERAMLAGGRFGGHMVAGHVDDTGVITNIKRDDNAVWFTISASDKILHYCVEKGSITIDGISLTIAGLSQGFLQVSVIPHTLSETVLGHKQIGDIINLENDMVGKYIEKFVTGNQTETKDTKLTKEMLFNAGF